MSIFKDHIYLLTPYFKSLLAEATKKTSKEGGFVLILVSQPKVMWNSARKVWAPPGINSEGE